MGLFGGGNSSKKTENNIDNSALNAAGNTGLAVMGDSNQITLTDQGAVAEAFGFGSSALNSMQESSLAALEFGQGAMDSSYGFSSGVTDRAFDSIEASSEAAYGFAADAFGSAMGATEVARAEAFNVISENNKRIDEVYKTTGRESAEDSMTIIKLMAGLVGVGLVVMAVKNA